MQGICKNNFMKLSDIYFNQNQCIYEMDTVKGFIIVPTNNDIIICLGLHPLYWKNICIISSLSD